MVPVGAQTARAVDRYLRARRAHRLAQGTQLWLGERGKGFTDDALDNALAGRAETAAVTGFRPHRLWHTTAHHRLAAGGSEGGSEGGLMAVAAWTRPDMLLRYTRARDESRAADEARGLGLGE